MPIDIIDGFNVNKGVPIDTNRTIKATIAERDSIPMGVRYEGMETRVIATKTKYVLEGGIANANWKPMVNSSIPDYAFSSIDEIRGLDVSAITSAVDVWLYPNKVYEWDAFSVVADNGDTILKPIGMADGTAGRFVLRTELALKDHNHNGQYAQENHEHDSYAHEFHDHDQTYAPKEHEHDESYALKDHNHNGQYAPEGHDHDGQYATTDHDHQGVYAEEGHRHDGEYQDSITNEIWACELNGPSLIVKKLSNGAQLFRIHDGGNDSVMVEFGEDGRIGIENGQLKLQRDGGYMEGVEVPNTNEVKELINSSAPIVTGAMPLTLSALAIELLMGADKYNELSAKNGSFFFRSTTTNRFYFLKFTEVGLFSLQMNAVGN